MLKSDAIKREKELLTALHNEFTLMDYDVETSNADDNGIGDMLTFEFTAGLNSDTVLANHYFMPVNEDEVLDSYLVQSLTILDEVPEDKKIGMLQAVNVLNHNVPYGSFQFDTDIDVLNYKNVLPVPASMGREDAFNYLTRNLLMGFGTVSLFISAIVAFFEERITWDEYLYALADAVANPD